MRRVLAIVLPLMLAQTGAAVAESQFTALDLDRCRDVSAKPEPGEPDIVGVWRCRGFGGMPIQVIEGDLRTTVSYGPRAADEPAAGEFTNKFSYVGKTIEWRGRRVNGAFVPYATVLRFFVTLDNDDGTQTTGQALVVTRLPPGPVCRVGAVDARANADADRLAGQIADEVARDFKCGTDMPVVRGGASRTIEALGLRRGR